MIETVLAILDEMSEVDDVVLTDEEREALLFVESVDFLYEAFSAGDLETRYWIAFDAFAPKLGMPHPADLDFFAVYTMMKNREE